MSLIKNYEYIRDGVNHRFLEELQSYYSKTSIDQRIELILQSISDITQFDYQVCETRPQTGKKGIIYLVPNEAEGEDVYDEYVYINNKGERLGPKLDLSSKQDVIQDLVEIRSGAQSGSTAVQPNVLASSLATKQDVISDLNTIRSGATAGSTAYQKPINGIPAVDLTNEIQTSLNKADSAVQHAELTEYVQSTPIGEINPTITPGIYATKEELPELVNNLTTNDATKGLSAAQGVALKAELSQLDQKVEGKDKSATLVKTVTSGSSVTGTMPFFLAAGSYKVKEVQNPIGSTGITLYFKDAEDANISTTTLVRYIDDGLTLDRDCVKVHWYKSGTASASGDIILRFEDNNPTAGLRQDLAALDNKIYGITKCCNG